jgi:hypothetical protein
MDGEKDERTRKKERKGDKGERQVTSREGGTVSREREVSRV